MRALRFSIFSAISPVVILLAACKTEAPADFQQQHIKDVVAAGGVVDSILPIAVQLDRFRVGIDRLDTLRHSSANIDALVARWAKAVATSDTVELNHMLVDRAEFAWLYYPNSAMSKPPYEAPPQLLWGQILASSNEGTTSMLNKFGGKPLEARKVTCPDAPVNENGSLLHQRCAVQLIADGKLLPANSYFGTIVERDKRFKFLGYANKL